MTSSVRTSRKSVQSALQNCFFPFFRSIKQRQAQSYGGPQLSRQNRKPHGKNKNITAKTKYLTAKPKTSRQKQKYLTAKPKTSRQNQILHCKNKIALVLPWVFDFPISGNAFDGKRRKKRGWPNTCSMGWQLCRFCHGLFSGPANADVVMRRTGKRDEVHVCLRG